MPPAGYKPNLIRFIFYVKMYPLQIVPLIVNMISKLLHEAELLHVLQRFTTVIVTMVFFSPQIISNTLFIEYFLNALIHAYA